MYMAIALICALQTGVCGLTNYPKVFHDEAECQMFAVGSVGEELEGGLTIMMTNCVDIGEST